MDSIDDVQRVVQQTSFDASVDDVWPAIADAEGLAGWLGAEVDIDVRRFGAGRVVDHDGTIRQVLVTDVEVGRRVAWHWWSDCGELSSVELTIADVGGRTVLSVSELLTPRSDADADSATASCRRRWTRATSSLWNRVNAFAPSRA